MWDIGKAIALVRCLNVLRNHNIALSLLKSHIYIQNMNGASMQEFHKHTRYQNKCGLYFTLANESCGSFTLGQPRGWCLSQNTWDVQKVLSLGGSIVVPTTLRNNRQTVRGRQASVILLSVCRTDEGAAAPATKHLSTVASLVQWLNQMAEIF